tara:strand:- start:662 stop:1990 length:1329 start_codon:yes stop_codon:yes gene_type:complete
MMQLKTITFSGLVNWSIQYLLEATFSYNLDYSLVPISKFLTRNKTSINIEDGVEYKRVTIRANNLGIHLRDTEKGENIGTKKQFVIKKGQFLVSKIDARNGAFGVIPDEVDGAVITGNFWTFDVDTSIINPYFLSLIVTTPEFIKFCENASNGTTNRHYLQEDLFLAQPIPLPPLPEQNRIVAQYNQKIKLAQQQEQEADNLENEIIAYLYITLGIPKNAIENRNTKLMFLMYSNMYRWDGKDTSILKSNYKLLRVEDLIKDISTGTTPPTNRKEYFENGSVNFYTPADLTDTKDLFNADRKVTELAIKENKARRFIKDTLLFVGIGSTVGKVGIIKSDYATSNQQITGVYFDFEKVDINYIYYFFNYFQHITTSEKTQSTIPIVNQNKILNIQVPIPDKKIQLEIVNHINDLKRQIKDLRIKAHKNREEALFNFEQEIFNS